MGKIYNIEEIKTIKPYGFIYITTNKINGRKYIGQKKFDKGWKNYLGSGKLLKQAIKKYGKENFTREIISIAFLKEELNTLEISFISYYDAVNSNEYYNLSHGGEAINAGLHFSEESKKKMSDARKRKYNSKYRRKSPTKETKKKISDAVKGEKNHNYGKSPSEETKEKVRLANLGRKHTKEELMKMSESHIKINKKQENEIREKYATGKYTQSELSKEYLVGQSTINSVIRFKGAYKIKIK